MARFTLCCLQNRKLKRVGKDGRKKSAKCTHNDCFYIKKKPCHNEINDNQVGL